MSNTNYGFGLRDMDSIDKTKVGLALDTIREDRC